MSSSSRASSFEYECEPDSPAPPCRPWKYLDHPDAQEWMRGPLEVREYPNLGDFVVLSIDPVASVAHLDAAAKQDARRIPRRKYVALCHQTTGLPIPTKPTHPYDFLFVRKGRPQPRLAGIDTEESCIAILPNDTVVSDRLPVTPAHPLPWDDCYLDITYGFPYGCRVTSTDRDYIPVLPILDTEATRIEKSLQTHWSPLMAERRKREEQWPQPLALVTLPALSSSDAQEEPMKVPASTQSVEHAPELTSSTKPETNSAEVVDDRSDEISLIESDDGRQDEHSPESGGDEELDTLLAFESMMNDVGDLRDPVVNVWYDLDVVTQVIDPLHFLEDVKRLHLIIDEAEIRLGIRPDPASVDRVSGRDEDADSQHSVGPSVKLEAVGKPPQDVRTDKGPKSSTTARKGFRARIRSPMSRLASHARALVRKLVFVRCSRSSDSKSKF